jgi:hypothetical protein
MTHNSPEVSNFIRLVLKSTGSFVTNRRFSLDIGATPMKMIRYLIFSCYCSWWLHVHIVSRPVYTMDHESRSKAMQTLWLAIEFVLGSLWFTHQGQDVRVIMKFEVLKMHFLRPTLFIDMVQQVLRWKRQKRCYGKKKVGIQRFCNF